MTSKHAPTIRSISLRDYSQSCKHKEAYQNGRYGTWMCSFVECPGGREMNFKWMDAIDLDDPLIAGRMWIEMDDD